MPPKKKKQEPVEMVEFDVEIMNPAQLKEYAHMLENDIETMRSFCSFYQKAEDKSMDVYKMRREQLKEKEELLLGKDIEMERLNRKVLLKIQEKEEKPTYESFSKEELNNRLNAEKTLRLEQEKEMHKQKVKQLQEKLREKERELETKNIKMQIERRAAMEEADRNFKENEDYEKHEVQKCQEKSSKTLNDTKLMNRLMLESLEIEATEGKRHNERKFQSLRDAYKRKLHDYYKDITRQDLDAIKTLAEKAKKLDTNIRQSKSKLEAQQTENAKLKATSNRQRRFQKTGIKQKVNKTVEQKRDLTEDRKVENLKKENETLEERIKKLEEETDNLRKNFTRALYKVRQSAETKALFLEEKIRSMLNEKEDENTAENMT